MLYYEGLTCPVCKKPFTDGADVVVCPVCGLPHHRLCWTIENHCAAQDTHGTPQQWSRETAAQADAAAGEQDDTQVCAHCAAVSSRYAEFCHRCGNELPGDDWHSTQAPPPPVREYSPRYTPFSAAESYPDAERIGTATAAQLAALVQANTPYYMARFRRKNQGKLCGWNWAAFLLGPLWLLYRKQYLTGALLFVLNTLFNVVFLLFNASLASALGGQVSATLTLAQMQQSPWFTAAMFASAGVLLMHAALGLFGNNLYLRFCTAKIAKAQQVTPDISSHELSTAGGVSFGVAAVFYLLSSLLSEILVYLLL